jgi:hypothetical protein
MSNSSQHLEPHGIVSTSDPLGTWQRARPMLRISRRRAQPSGTQESAVGSMARSACMNPSV